ncbi:MAG: hypothetical protein AABX89_07550 [Candidatus Thermoplasmatota archaeon]
MQGTWASTLRLRLLPIWATLLILAGMALLVAGFRAEDPCCHEQTPGLVVAGLGAFPLTAYLVRLRRFHRLLSTAHRHNFRTIHKQLGELASRLGPRERSLFEETARRFA